MKHTVLLLIGVLFLMTMPAGCASTMSGFRADSTRNYNYVKGAVTSRPLPRPLN